MIKDFCSAGKLWGVTVVLLISFGTGLTSAGGGKALGVDNRRENDHTAPDGIWMSVSFADNGCIGDFNLVFKMPARKNCKDVNTAEPFHKLQLLLVEDVEEAET